MNEAANAEKTMPLPVPMSKETTVKDDGRFLIYYTFPPEPNQPTALVKKEDADV